MERVYRVPKIKCEGCAETITTALSAVAGVSATRVGVAEKEVRIEFDPARVDEAQLSRTLADAGFPPTSP